MAFGGGTFGRSLGHEGKVLMNGINVLIKETQRVPLSLSPRVDIVRMNDL